MKPQRIPKQGEIVTVRQRTYTVTDVRQNTNQSVHTPNALKQILN